MNNIFRYKVGWVTIPVIVAIWLNVILLHAYLVSVNQEQIIIDINSKGEMWFEIVLLSFSLILTIFSFVQILLWRYRYHKAEKKL